MVSHAGGLVPDALALASTRAWNWAHSDAAERRGVRLTLVADRPPKQGRVSGPVAIFGVSRAARPVFLSFDDFVRSAPTLAIQEVERMRDVPATVLDALARQGFSRQLPRQVSGYWYGPRETVPAARPDWAETGALLPAVDGLSTWLLLAMVDGWWRPMAFSAVPGYGAPGGIERGETWWMLPTPSDPAEWGRRKLQVRSLVAMGREEARCRFAVPRHLVRDDQTFAAVTVCDVKG